MPPADGTGELRVRVGYRPRLPLFTDAAALRAAVARAEASSLARLCVGDHVTFRGGQGYDGLVQATALIAQSARLQVATTVYLLPLRHPVTVARQVASIADLGPGRFAFGVGVGGDDRSEVRACGVDPATRGRRTDESLGVVRALLAGDTVDLDGEFFQLHGVTIGRHHPTPVPILVGGRSDAALRRAGRLSEGWLGVWVSPRRFAEAAGRVEETAAAEGRDVVWQHAIQVWCGFGASPEAARPHIAAAMESLYARPFADFERWSPLGTAEDVAEALAPFVDGGCRDINLISIAADADEALEQTIAVSELLNESR
jgi:alkanesulfonate monooxygenase SsuD/methylene tetrahydromethanopterin reductase-like flavin-dependent oxidoreductase (luciferase family)